MILTLQLASTGVCAPLSRNHSGVQAEATAVMRKLGLLHQALPSVRTQILPPGQNVTVRGAATVAPAANRNSNATPLLFSFTGFSAANQQVLTQFLQFNYQAFVDIYGDPSPTQQGKTVTVVGNGDFENAYSPPAIGGTTGGTIFFRYREDINPTLSGNFNRFNFARLVLAAFHGRQVFAFNYAEGQYVDAWERGFADAAALMVAYRAQGAPANFDPSLLGTYVLPVYDLLNQPQLGNAFFFPLSGDDLVVGAFRVALAQSAWFKVLVEDPNFFKDFHVLYYAQWSSDGVLAANVPALRALAAQATANVEGTAFQDWYRKQFVLDTSVTTGPKLYVVNLPLPNATSGDTRSGFQASAHAFTTSANGGESGNSGLGSVAVLDETGQDVSSLSSELRTSNVITFSSDTARPGQATFGAGFSSLGTTNQARLTIRVRAGAVEATAPFPYNVAGSTNTSARFYGVVSAASAGTLAVVSNGVTGSAPVARGAWTTALPYVSGPRVQTALTINGRTTRRNTAWLQVGANTRSVAFVADGRSYTQSTTVGLTTGTARLRMITVPIFPRDGDEAQIFGIAPNSLQLARYRPNLSPGTFTGGGLQFGIGINRHEIYPNISQPVIPGKGYWITVDSPYQRVVPGTLPPQSTPFAVPISGGWNQVGVPFARSYSPYAITVSNGGFAAVSFAEAISRGWISPGIWRWKPTSGYERVDIGTATIPAFEGFYIFTPKPNGVVLHFNPAAGAVSAPSLAGWNVRLMAATSSNRDNSSRFGVSTNAPVAPRPPSGNPSINVRFLSSGSALLDAGGSGAASGWADSFLPSLEKTASWEFLVEGVARGRQITLSWPQPTGLPQNSKLLLTDTVTGKVTGMKMNLRYAFTSSGSSRRFRVVALRYAVPTLTAAVTSSTPVQLTVNNNLEATGTLSLWRSGQKLRDLRRGSFPVGKSVWIWDGLDSDGNLVTPGPCSARFEANDEHDKDGETHFEVK